ncbi:MAG: hypothetical protein B6I25_07450 [Planctomycetales bacterium 4572_13]|nr:MAG: hypothetical protein B6I25_07450 [Planctomycetales bacterium 4572_13]
MADIIQEMQKMGERMIEMRGLFKKREILVSQLSEIDREIKAVLDTEKKDVGGKGKFLHPNESTDPYCLIEVMSDKPMHKSEIMEAIKEKGFDFGPDSLAWYLSKYECFQSKGRGYWVYIKP